MTRTNSDLAGTLSANSQDPTPSDPSFHWHSVVQARGWEQPRLDGGNGGWAVETFCASQLLREMNREDLEHRREASHRQQRHEIPGSGDRSGGAARR